MCARRMERVGAVHGGLTRRDVLRRFGAGALFSLGTAAWPGCRSAEGRAAGGAFRFLAVNDLHHASASCDPWFEALVRQMRAHDDVELALLLGDLADDAQPASHAAVRAHFAGLGVPVVATPGNHDLRSARDRAGYDAAFPKSTNRVLRHRGWQLVLIDSTQGTEYENTRVSAETLAWLDATLPRMDRRRPTVLATHFPLGTGVKMRPLNADAVLERFLEFNLRGVLGGHYHASTRVMHRGVDVVTNRCCARVRGNHDGSVEKGYFLVHCGEGGMRREFVPFGGVA